MRRGEDMSHEGDHDDEGSRMDREHLQALRRARQGRVTKLLIVLGILVIFIVFIIGNSEDHNIDFVFVESQVPLIWVMLACAILGMVVGFFLGRPGKQFRFHRRDEDRKD